MTFAEATAVSRAGEGRYRSEILPGWDNADRTNGGYLSAIATRAAAEATGRPDPVAITTHFLSPGRPGPLTIDTQVVRRGGRFTFVRLTLATAEQPILVAQGAMADLTSVPTVADVGDGPPDLPPFESCERLEPSEAFPAHFLDRVDVRLHPGDAGFLDGVPNGSGVMRGWISLPSQRRMDSVAAVFTTSAFPPAIRNMALPMTWTPTLERTMHVRGVATDGPLRCRFRSRFVAGGFVEEDSELWDVAGSLVADARSLSLVPRG